MGVQAAALHQAVLKHWLESDKFYTHLDPRGGVFTPSYDSVFPALLAPGVHCVGACPNDWDSLLNENGDRMA